VVADVYAFGMNATLCSSKAYWAENPDLGTHLVCRVHGPGGRAVFARLAAASRCPTASTLGFKGHAGPSEALPDGRVRDRRAGEICGVSRASFRASSMLPALRAPSLTVPAAPDRPLVPTGIMALMPDASLILTSITVAEHRQGAMLTIPSAVLHRPLRPP
jgi:hypothetical protein